MNVCMKHFYVSKHLLDDFSQLTSVKRPHISSVYEYMIIFQVCNWLKIFKLIQIIGIGCKGKPPSIDILNDAQISVLGK